MLHHISFGVTDLARSGAFYDAALAPLNYVRVWTRDKAIGYGVAGGGDKFAIRLQTGALTVPGELFHPPSPHRLTSPLTPFTARRWHTVGRTTVDRGSIEYGAELRRFRFRSRRYRIEAVIHDAV
jgi:catechol 2,3-dioxygenase-like lactoylglutathione lyase family enzyme